MLCQVLLPSPYSAQLKLSMCGCMCDMRGSQRVSMNTHTCTHAHNLTRIINLNSGLKSPSVRKKCCASIFISCERSGKVCDQNWIMCPAAFIDLGAAFGSGVHKGMWSEDHVTSSKRIRTQT